MLKSQDNCVRVSGVTGVTTVLDEYMRARRNAEGVCKKSLLKDIYQQDSKTPETGEVLPLENQSDCLSRNTLSHPETPLRHPPLAFREVLSMPLAQISHLPLKPTLWLAVPGISAEVAFTASRAQAARAIVGQRAVLTPKEYIPACYAAENDRAWPEDLRSWVERKLRAPGWRLTEAMALGGKVGGLVDRKWTLDACLRRLGASLCGVGLGDDLEPVWGSRSATGAHRAA